VIGHAWLAPLLAASLQLAGADAVSPALPVRTPAVHERPAPIFRRVPPQAEVRVEGAPVTLYVNDSYFDPQVVLSWKEWPIRLIDAVHAVEASPTESCIVEWEASRGATGHETWWLDRARGLLVARAPAALRDSMAGSAAWNFRCPALGVNEFAGGYAPSATNIEVTTPAPTESHPLMVNGAQYGESLPEAIKKVAPLYPADAHAEGIVVVKAHIETDGSVGACEIVRSIPELDAAAMASVKLWKFKPALSNGKAVAVWCVVPVRFTRPE